MIDLLSRDVAIRSARVVAAYLASRDPAEAADAHLQGEDTAQSLAANLPPAQLKIRLVRAIEIAGAGRGDAAEDTATDAVRDRAQTLLTWAEICLDVTDQDYAAPQFSRTPDELILVASAAMFCEDTQVVADATQYLRVYSEVTAARDLAREAFIAASLGDQLGQ